MGLRELTSSNCLQWQTQITSKCYDVHTRPNPVNVPFYQSRPKQFPDKMADENVPDPTRIDEQLVPVKARLPIGKSNLLMDLQKKQKNPIFLISVDILQNTNFFNAFTASVDDADLLRSVLGITPKDSAHPFVAPPAGDLVDITSTKGHRFLFTLQQMTIHSEISNFTPKENWMRYSEWLFLKTINDVIHNSEYYQKYLDMAACKPCQATTVTYEEGGNKKKAPPAGKSKKLAHAKQPALAKQTKPVKEKTSKSSP
ncbi:hypothetical protein Tco_1132568 [Tanacetum coccineum]|uniref:Uncharacterized protein n=1 Tax=Tanacetum coccineum TaxID=301880 RepID=A0ABQ5JF23_9ASTR